MTITTEQLIQFFNVVESLLTEFHSAKGYTTVLAPLVDLQTKKPKINGADGNKKQDSPGRRGKKEEGKGGKTGKKDGKDGSSKEGEPSYSGSPPGGTSAGGGKKTEGGKPADSSTKTSEGKRDKDFKKH
eukprot:600203-Amphidinium_carterae.1